MIKFFKIHLFLLLSSTALLSQARYSQVSPIQQKLNQAQALKKDKPIEAIKILEGVFGSAKRAKDPVLESEAYYLLGEIYEDIGQQKLAKQRYQSALELIKNSPDKLRLANNWLALGRINYDLQDLNAARTAFQQCVNLQTKDAIEVKCREGLADAAIAQNQFDKGQSYNFDITQMTQFKKDSLLQSKVAARNSVIFSNQNQTQQAQQSYFNSLQNLPQQPISEKDYAPIKKAKQRLNDKSKTPQEQISLNIQSLELSPIQQLPINSVLEKQLQLADLYLEQNNIPKAEEYIASSLEAIKKGASRENKAAVFKKSSDINYKKGNYELALADYEKYTQEKDKILQTKEIELNDLIAILKGQEKIDLIAKDVELEEKDAILLQNQLFSQRIIIGLLSILLLAAAIGFYLVFKNIKARKRANQLLLLKSLRTQMNPHFIFNALNSINNFIAKNDERAANKFLTDFSKLMRMVLNHSQKDFIGLEEELGLIQLYLKLEHLRFRDKFDYSFESKTNLLEQDLQIPPMLIQPFIENAIWHGLRYKTKKGRLLVQVVDLEQAIQITIMDDGIGRSKSNALKTSNQKSYQSEGMKNIAKRLQLINEVYQKNYTFSIEDVDPQQEDTGTIIQLIIPKNSIVVA